MTLAIHPGQEGEDVMSESKKAEMQKENEEMAKAAGVAQEEIQQLQSSIRKIFKNVKNLMMESKMSMIRQDGHNKAVDANQR